MIASKTPRERDALLLSRSAARCFWPPALPLTGCSEVSNNPHPLGSEKTNTIFVPILSRSPKYLDPTSSYSNDETPFTYQIYEPLYGYHYLKRPYELVGRAAEEVAHPLYLDKDGKVLRGRCAGRGRRRNAVRHQAEAGHQVRAASGVREERAAASTSITT